MIPAPTRPAQPDAAPARWQALWRDAVRDPRELLDLLGLPWLRTRLAPEAMTRFPLRVPRGFVARMRRGDPDDPLLRQVLPLDAEDRLVPGFVDDAVGDADARGATGVIQKYEGRALLVATGSCAIHCRYCFRRHFPYAEETAAAGRWREAIDYLRADGTVHEVILSGGDPLSLATARLADLTDALRDVGHVRRLRLHTRLPVVLPERVDAELSAWLRGLPWPVAVVVHANHPAEIDDAVVDAFARLRLAGATVLNQAVLLRGVNDDAGVLATLSETLFAAGVLPYYLHQLDRVAGTAHFEVDDATALALHDRLQARLPGYLVPRLVREVPGAPAKTPLPVVGA
jgi:EF-P beta-lysylation protein EpmB